MRTGFIRFPSEQYAALRFSSDYNAGMYCISSKIPILLCALLLSGCVSLPINNESIDDPALVKISKAYETTVQTAHNDPDKQWQSGWLGNMWIHFSESEQRGLCYEWKYLVHAGVLNTVKEVGWETRGIAINENTRHEHHAVLVYDPSRITAADLLSASPQAPAYVLDAWRQGEADIYTVTDWLKSNFKTESPARLFIIKPGDKRG